MRLGPEGGPWSGCGGREKLRRWRWWLGLTGDPGGRQGFEDDRIGRAEQIDEEAGGVAALVVASLEEADLTLEDMGAAPGAMASEGLAVDDGGADRLLGPVVGGGNRGLGLFEDGPERIALGPEVAGELSVLTVGGLPGGQSAHPVSSLPVRLRTREA